MSKKLEIPQKDLENEIIAVLDRTANKPGGNRTKPGCNLVHGKACALGTCIDNKPRVTPIDLYHDGLTPWLGGEPGGKIANIMRNPNVSIGVYEPVDHSIEQKSLQIWGTAELFNLKNNPDEFNRRLTAFGLDEALRGMIDQHVQAGELPAEHAEAAFEKATKMFNFIKVTPEKIVLLHMFPDKRPVRKVWEPGKAYIKTR